MEEKPEMTVQEEADFLAEQTDRGAENRGAEDRGASVKGAEDSDIVLSSLIGSLQSPLVIPRALLVAAGSAASAVALATLLRWSTGVDDSVALVDTQGEIWVVPAEANWWDAARLAEPELGRAVASLKSSGLVDVKNLKFTTPSGEADDRPDVEGPAVAKSSDSVRHYRVVPSAVARAYDAAVTLPVATSKKRKTAERKQTEEDVERLDEAHRLAYLLAQLVAINASKPPPAEGEVLKPWVQAIDQMVRIDGIAPASIERAILWSQAHPFWCTNIRSAVKFRKQYEVLRMRAATDKREAKEGRSRGDSKDPEVYIERSRSALAGNNGLPGTGQNFGDGEDDGGVGDANGDAKADEMAISWGLVWDEAQGRYVRPDEG